MLVLVRASDIYAQSSYNQSERMAKVRLFSEVFQSVYDSSECFSLRDLAINGNDLIQIGFCPGPKMGEILSTLLENVIDGNLQNKRESLLQFARCHLTFSEDAV